MGTVVIKVGSSISRSERDLPVVVQAPPISAEPSPRVTSRVKVSTASATSAAGSGAETVTVRVVVSVAPSSSVAVRVIEYVPASV